MTNYTFQSLFDFTRTTSGTFVGSNGLIQTTPASVNLLLQTQAFDNASWTKFNSTINANVTSAPDGTSTADALVENTTSGNHIVQQFVSYTSGASYTFSFYVKAGTRAWTRITMPSAAFGTEVSSFYNLSGAGSLGTASGPVTARTITAVGNGWYRITLTGVATATAGGNTIVFSASADNTSFYTGVTGAEAIFIWGAQVEAAATATDYTRNNGGVYPPRFDYDPATLQPKGILIEEQRVNRTLQSENFTVSPWAATVVGTSTRVNDNSALGFMRGLVTATSANGGIRQTYTGLASGQVYALSFYIQSTTTAVSVFMENGTVSFGGPHNVTINPSNGTAGALTGFTSVTITPFSSGYIYTLITAPAGGTLLANFEWRIVASGDSMLYGRPQLEAGAFATSYIPTVASQVTRAADSCAIVAPMFAPWYNQSEGTFVVEATPRYPSTLVLRQPLVVSDGTASNYARIYTYTTFFGGQTTAAGVTQADTYVAGSYTENVTTNFAMALQANNFAASANGSAVTTDTSGTLPTFNRMDLGSFTAGQTFNGHIRSIRYYPVRLSDAQLQALTA
jgi:hypothetical protein